VAYLQFDTRPTTLLYHTRNALPDRLLPRPWRRGIRRIGHVPESLQSLFQDHGLDVCRELGPGSEYNTFILRAQ
jgi:hypothetical protein